MRLILILLLLSFPAVGMAEEDTSKKLFSFLMPDTARSMTATDQFNEQVKQTKAMVRQANALEQIAQALQEMAKKP